MYNEVDIDFKHNNSNNDITKNYCDLLSIHSVRPGAVKLTHIIVFDLQSATVSRELLLLSPFLQIKRKVK